MRHFLRLFMLKIPLKPTPSQTVSVVLAQQYCTINLYQKTTGMYFDLFLNGAPVVMCMMVRDRLALVREAYQGFVGNLMLVDLQGRLDPDYSGLGSRWALFYKEVGDE
jgi:hypothetical protein